MLSQEVDSKMRGRPTGAIESAMRRFISRPQMIRGQSTVEAIGRVSCEMMRNGPNSNRDAQVKDSQRCVGYMAEGPIRKLIEEIAGE